MKKFTSLAAAAFVLLASAPAHALTNLVLNGDFSAPALPSGQSYSIFSSIPDWTNAAIYNGGADGLEIGKSSVYGLPCANAACLNLEVNAYTFGDVKQTVTGLVAGKTYDLSWDYGGRNGGGAQQLDVYFGGALVAVDSSTGANAKWTHNAFAIVATGPSETLEFKSLNVGGTASYGNELANVTLFAPAPGPAGSILTLALLPLLRRLRRRA